MTDIGDLQIILSAKDNATATLRSFSSELKNVDTAAQQSSRSFDLFGGGITGALAKASIGIYGIKNISQVISGGAQALFSYNAGLEQTTVAFKGLTGSMSGATSLMNNLKTLAAQTPLELNQVTSSAQRLLGVGVQAQQIPGWLTDIGDAAMAMGGGAPEIDRITLALTQMMARGKIDGQDMMQIAQTNVNAWGALAAGTGKTTAQLQELSQKGLLPAKEYIPELVAGMEDLFGGQMQAQAHTFNGEISSISDNLHQAFGKISMPIFNVAKQELSDFLDYTNSQDFSKLEDRLTAGAQSFADQIGPFLQNDIPTMVGSLETAAHDAGDVASALKTVYDYASDANNALGGQGWKLLGSLVIGAKVGGKIADLLPKGTAGTAAGEAGNLLSNIGTMTVVADIVNVNGAIAGAAGVGSEVAGAEGAATGVGASGAVRTAEGLAPEAEGALTAGGAFIARTAGVVGGAITGVFGEALFEMVMDIITHGQYQGIITKTTNAIGQSGPAQDLKQLFTPSNKPIGQQFSDTGHSLAQLVGDIFIKPGESIDKHILQAVGLVPTPPTPGTYASDQAQISQATKQIQNPNSTMSPRQKALLQQNTVNQIQLPDAKGVQLEAQYNTELNKEAEAQAKVAAAELKANAAAAAHNQLVNKNTVDVIQDTTKAQLEQIQTTSAAMKAIQANAKATQDFATAQKGSFSVYLQLQGVQEQFSQQAKLYSGDIQAMSDARDALNERIKAGLPISQEDQNFLKNYNQLVSDEKTRLQGATIQKGEAAAATAAQAKVLDDLKTVTGGATQGTEKYNDAMKDLGPVIQNAISLMAHGKGATDAQNQAYQQMAAIASGPTLDAVIQVGTAMGGLTSKNLTVAIQVVGMEQIVQARIQAEQGAYMPIYIETVGKAPSAEAERATGGFVQPGEALTLVGERGPELAIYPYASGGIVGANGPEVLKLPTGTQILTAAQTQQILGSSTPAASDLAQAIVTGAGKDLSRIPSMMKQINDEVMVQVEKLKNTIKSELDQSILSGDDAKTIQSYKDQLTAIGDIETDWAKKTGTSVGSVISKAVQGALSDQSWQDILQSWGDTLTGANMQTLSDKIGDESRQLAIAQALGASKTVIDGIAKQLAQDKADLAQSGKVVAEAISSGLLQDTVWQNAINNVGDLISGKLQSDALNKMETDQTKLGVAMESGASKSIIAGLQAAITADQATLKELGVDMADAVSSGMFDDQVWTNSLANLPDLISGKLQTDALSQLEADQTKLGYAMASGAEKSIIQGLQAAIQGDKETLAELGRDMSYAISSGMVDEQTWMNDLANINDLLSGSLLTQAQGKLLTDQNALKLAIAGGAEQPIVAGLKAAVAADQAQIKQIGVDMATAMAQGLASPDQWNARIGELSGLMDGTLIPQLKDSLKQAEQSLQFGLAIGAPQTIIDGLQQAVQSAQQQLSQAGADMGAAVKAGLIKSLQLTPDQLDLVGNIVGTLGDSASGLVGPMIAAVGKGAMTTSQAAGLLTNSMELQLPQVAQQELQQLAEDLLAGKDTSGDVQQLQAIQGIAASLGVSLSALQQAAQVAQSPADQVKVPMWALDPKTGKYVQIGTSTQMANPNEELPTAAAIARSASPNELANGALDDTITQAIQQAVTAQAQAQTAVPGSAASDVQAATQTTKDAAAATQSNTTATQDNTTAQQNQTVTIDQAIKAAEASMTGFGNALDAVSGELAAFAQSVSYDGDRLRQIIASIPAGGVTTAMAEGGTLWEPVAGVGLHTGRRYLMGEAGPEDVTPRGKTRSRAATSGQPLIVNVNVGNKRLDQYLGSYLRDNIKIGGS